MTEPKKINLKTSIMQLTYNIPVEVTESQYNAARSILAGLVMHRKADGKFFIKLMLPKYRGYAESLLNARP